MNKFLVIGQGAIGAQVSNWLADNACDITGLARQDKDTYPLTEEVKFLQVDVTKLTQEQTKNMADFTHIAIIVTPDDYSEEGYEQSYYSIAKKITEMTLPKLQRLVFISSTGVYGQNNGELVDENTPPKLPTRVSSQIILRTEQLLQEVFKSACVIIRPSGIYGCQRLMRIRKAKEINKQPMVKQAWTNRIMDTDLVNIIGRVLTMHKPKPLYLATDHEPVTSFALTTWLCEQLNTPLPIVINKNSDENEAFMKAVSGKRIVSNIPKDWLSYPNWQLGYEYILKNMPESNTE